MLRCASADRRTHLEKHILLGIRLLESPISEGRWLRCRSLCIIDEFGKGTLTTDGVGLLAAALHQLATAAEPPKVVAATHFSELLKIDYLPRLAANCAD